MIPSEDSRARVLEHRRRRVGGLTPAQQRQVVAMTAGTLPFPAQAAFVQDTASKAAACCTRRAGKSHGIGIKLLTTAMRDARSDCLYITQTQKEATRLMWLEPDSGLPALDRKYGLGFHFDHAKNIATSPAGAHIYLGGAKDSREVDALRGGKLALAVIDEAQSIKADLEETVFGILEPRLMDLAGQLVLTGTPGRVLAGTYYEVTRQDGRQRPGWSVHQWSVAQNPHIPNAEEFIAAKARENGWDLANPPARYLREYRGLWVRETATLVYAYDRARNTYAELPKGIAWRYVLGIDIGSRDATAFRVWAYHPDHPTVYGVHGWKGSRLDVTAIAERIKGTRHMAYYSSTYAGPVHVGLLERFGPMRIVADTGGLGLMIVEELNNRHALAIEPAEKTGKAAFVEAMNADLRNGNVRVLADDPVVGEWESLQWEDPGDDPNAKQAEDPRMQNDLADASLYGWREARHYLAQAQEPAILYGTPDWYRAEELRMEQLAEARYKPNSEKAWWQ